MNYRIFGKTGFKISEISLGTWQVGGKWGRPFDSQLAQGILEEALDKGVNFIDTADVYSAGDSEKAVGQAIRNHSSKVYVASKCGRQLNPHISESYQPDVLTRFVEDSLRRMDLETLDLIQLHCPPSDVYYRPEIFEAFERMKESGKIQHLGVSVEKVEEGIKALEYPNVSSVQIIFNMFRQRPAELFFEEAKRKNVGVIVRVPLASGLLTGLYQADTRFEKDDHRFFNREGAVFDKGETFSGIDYQKGLQAIHKIKQVFPQYENLAPLAIRWILMFDAVSCVIPGASRPEQVRSNLSALDIPAFSPEEMDRIKEIYEEDIKASVHQLW